MKLLLSILLCSILFACSKGEQNDQSIEGTYKGTFIRGTDTAQITISFSGLTFNGSSNKPYPVICNGSSFRTLDVISFDSACTNSLTDGLIGSFQYYASGDYLSFWRTINNTTQFYKLNRQ